MPLPCYTDNFIHNGFLFLSVAIMGLHIFRVEISQGWAAEPNAILVGVQCLIVLVVAQDPLLLKNMTTDCQTS